MLSFYEIQVQAAKDTHDLIKQIQDTRVFAVVASDEALKDPFAVIKIAQQVSDARWILFSAKQSIQFRTEAIVGYRIEEVLEYPIYANKVVGRVRKIWSDIQQKKVVIRKITRSEAPPTANPSSLLLPEKNSFPREKWPPLTQLLKNQQQKSSSDLQIEIDKILGNIMTGIDQTGRMSLISFGIHEPRIDDEIPPEFVVLNSSGERPSSEQTLSSYRYPELMKSLKLKQPVLTYNPYEDVAFRSIEARLKKTGIRSLAVLPLYSGTRVFGVLKLRFLKSLSQATLNGFLKEMTSYAEEMTPLALKLDFISRIYRNAKKNR